MLFVSGCAEEQPEEPVEEAVEDVTDTGEEIVDEAMPEEEMAEEEAAEEEMNIVETAVAAGNFDTLVAAVQAAGLEDTLSEEGPFTVFAPTDEAFDALPEGTLDDLLEDEEALTNVLLYHVADGELMAADVVEMESIETLQGEELTVNVTDDTVMVDGATIITTDIEASNGVIHVIDAVMIPPE